MSALLSALAALLALLAGAYVVVVLKRALDSGAGGIARAALSPLAEAASLLRQEDLSPRGADGLLFKSAPLVALTVAGLGALVIPLGPGLVGFDPSIGVFYFIVVLGPFVIAMMNAGWGQNTKAGLLGAFRAAPHLISYEVPLGFAVIGPVMAAESLSTVRIVEAQSSLWYAAWQPLGVVIYLVSALFMTYQHPFDIPQAGSELAGGVLAEYSGPRLLLYRIALNALFALLVALGVVVFLGGWQGPLLPAPVWFLLKVLGLAALTLWAVRFMPRLRHDQMLALAWKILLPASLVNVALVGILILFIPGVSQ
jgi:NADH-quinone oxidoreductase subunit H